MIAWASLKTNISALQTETIEIKELREEQELRLSEVQQALRESELENATLKQQVQVLEQSVRETEAHWQHLLCLKQQEAEEEKRQQEQALTSLEAQLKHLAEANAELECQQLLWSEVQAQRQHQFAQLNEAVLSMTEGRVQCESAIEQLKQAVHEAETQYETLQSMQAQLDARDASAHSNLERINENLAVLRKQLGSTRAEQSLCSVNRSTALDQAISTSTVQLLKEALRQQQEESSKLKQLYDQAQHDLGAANAAMSQWLTDSTSQIQERELLLEANLNLQQECSQLRANLASLTQKHHALQQSVLQSEKTCEALRTDLESARQAMNCEQAQATQTRQEIDKAHKEAVASIRSLEQLLAVRQDEIAELKALASQDKSDNVNAQQELQAKSSQLQELEEVISDLSEAVKQKHLRSSIIKPCRQLTQQPEHKFSSDTIFTNI
eukprot:m.41620 g.41620  ORF g.41620 m.41620 type:complete len:441 (+) comp11844_c0_seq1:250-1572(+)